MTFTIYGRAWYRLENTPRRQKKKGKEKKK